MCPADLLRNQVPRAPLDFLIDFCNIVSDDAQTDHNDTPDDQNQQDDRRKSFYRTSGKITHERFNPKDYRRRNTKTPATVTHCIGTVENDTIFFTAYLISDIVDHFDSPSVRSRTSNSTCVVR